MSVLARRRWNQGTSRFMIRAMFLEILKQEAVAIAMADGYVRLDPTFE